MTTLKRPHLSFVLLALVLIFSLLTPLALVPDGRSVLLTGRSVYNYPPASVAAFVPDFSYLDKYTSLTRLERDRHLLTLPGDYHVALTESPAWVAATEGRIRLVVQRVYKRTIYRRLY